MLIKPLGKLLVVTDRVGTIRSASEAVAVWELLSVRVMLAVKFPLTVGVPEMTPVLATTLRPLGKPVTAQL